MPANIELDSASLSNSLAVETVAEKQVAIKNVLGTGTLTVTVADGTGTPVATGTFAGTALQDTGDLIPSVQLSSASGAGGTPTDTWTAEVRSTAGAFIRGRFGSGGIWAHKNGGVAAPINTANDLFIRLNLGATAPAPAPSPSPAPAPGPAPAPAPSPPAAGEKQVLFSGSMQLTKKKLCSLNFNGFWPIAAEGFHPPSPDLFAHVTWHGGWGWEDKSGATVSARGRIHPELKPEFMWTRGTFAGMLDFMIRNRTKASGWDSTATTANTDYYFEDLGIWLDAAKAAGVTIAVNVHVQIWVALTAAYAPRIAINPITASRYCHAVKTMVNFCHARQPGVLAYVETCNEPWVFGNDAQGWNWMYVWGNAGSDNPATMPTASQWAQQTRLIKQAVLDSNAPQTLVVGPNINTMGPERIVGIKNCLTASAVGANGGYGTGSGTGKDWIDVLGVHGYIDPPPPVLKSDQSRYLQTRIPAIKAMLSDIGIPNKPIYVTEWMGQAGNWTDLRDNEDLPSTTMREDMYGLTADLSERWQWFNAAMILLSDPQVELFSHFTWGQPAGKKGGSWFGQRDAGGLVPANRAFWESIVRWLLEKPITRIVITNDDKVRVTRADGATFQTLQSF